VHRSSRVDVSHQSSCINIIYATKHSHGMYLHYIFEETRQTAHCFSSDQNKTHVQGHRFHWQRTWVVLVDRPLMQAAAYLGLRGRGAANFPRSLDDY
jgi:hypothetical protein